MAGNGSLENENLKTTPKQDAFIQAMLAGKSIVDAAKASGISIRTAHRWLSLPHIQEAQKRAKQQIFDKAISQLMLDVEKARSTLTSIMDDTSAPCGARVRAAQILLEQSISIHKMGELEQGIAELKEKVQ
jgi:phage terminase small subunit